MDEYYRVESRRVSLIEYWRLGGPAGVIAWLFKLFGVKLHLAAGIPAPTSPWQTQARAQDMPAGFRDRAEELVNECQAAHFESPLYYRMPGSLMVNR